MSESKRVLVVEDEPEIRQLIALHLKREGFLVTEVGDGEAATERLLAEPFNLVVMDWMLPGRSGLDITKWIRSRPQFTQTPILIATAKTEPEHIAAGLDAGADDYLPKPFDTLVLMARVNALLRRQEWLTQKTGSESQALSKELRVGELALNSESFESSLRGEKIELTRSEFKLLEALIRNQGKVLSREALIGEIQGEGVNVVGRTIDTHVFGLRKKLKDYGDVIETIRGVGYRVRYPSLAQ